MDKLTYEDFVKKELERWVQLNSEGKKLPGIVDRVLEVAYRNYTGDVSEPKTLEEKFKRDREDRRRMIEGHKIRAKAFFKRLDEI